MTQFSDLVGKTISQIAGKEGDDVLYIYTADGYAYRQLHHQDCCESVYLSEIVGDLSDLIGTPILLAEESSEASTESSESGTWTFYKLATAKGHVTIRWLGESNGYYSESVDFEEVGA